MSKRLLTISIIISLVLLLLVGATGGVFAYFNEHIDTDDVNITIGADSQLVVAVANESELLRYTKDSTYSSDERVSHLYAGAPDNNRGGNRTTVTLTHDIILTANAFVDADLHIDLGGHTLYLNGYSLFVEHTYASTFALTNGNINPYTQGEDIQTVAGKIVINIPNAIVLTNALNFVDNAAVALTDQEANIIRVLSTADNGTLYTAYNALYMAGQALKNETDETADRLSIDELIAHAITPTDNVYTLPTSLLHQPKLCLDSTCTFCVGQTNKLYTFVTQDLDLPFGYYGFDNVRISYVSSNEAVVSNGGKVTPVSNAVTKVTLTATATVTTQETQTVDNVESTVDVLTSAQCDFVLYVVSGDVNLNAVGIHLLGDYMADYYYDVDSTYRMFGEISLPTAFESYGTSITYTTDTGNISYITQTVGENTENIGIVCMFEANAGTTQLVATVANGGSSQTRTFPISYVVTDSQQTDATLARELLNAISPIETRPDGTSGINGYTYKDMPTSMSKNIQNAQGDTVNWQASITYTLQNDTEGIYELVTAGNSIRLRVASGKAPSVFQSVVLHAVVSVTANAITTQTEHEFNVPIVYAETGQWEGNNMALFLPYYNYFNDVLKNEINETYQVMTDFGMPLYYGTSTSASPIVAFEVVDDAGNRVEAVSLSVVYNDGTDHTIPVTVNVGETYIDALNRLFDSTSLATLIANTARWSFVIDKSLLPIENTEVYLRYYYKGSASSQTWLLYEDESNVAITRSITLVGILQPNGTGYDAVLYRWIYDNFNTNGDTYSAGDYVYVEWLDRDVTFDYAVISADARYGTISNFAYLQYLDSVRRVNMQGANCGNTALTYLGNMEKLEYLNLTNNGITDITAFSNVDNFKSLVTLYLSNNTIDNFAPLASLADTADLIYTDGNIGATSDASLWGSCGLYNMNTYIALMYQDTTVYCEVVDGTYLTLDKSSAKMLYVALSSIAIQKKVPQNTNITNLYASYSNLTLAQCLDGTTPIAADGTTRSAVSGTLAWSYEGTATESTTVYLTLTITNITSKTLSGNITIQLQYVVDRY